jgi:hypothetical protein
MPCQRGLVNHLQHSVILILRFAQKIQENLLKIEYNLLQLKNEPHFLRLDSILLF